MGRTIQTGIVQEQRPIRAGVFTTDTRHFFGAGKCAKERPFRAEYRRHAQQYKP